MLQLDANGAPVIVDTDFGGSIVEGTTFTTYTDGDSIVTNGDFESGDFSGWTLSGDLAAISIGSGAPTGAFVSIEPSDLVILSQEILSEGGQQRLTFSLHGGGMGSSVGVLIDGFPIFSIDDASEGVNVDFVFMPLTASYQIGLAFHSEQAGWQLDDVAILPQIAHVEVAPVQDTAGTIEFTDADLADTHTVTVQARGADYLGSFDTFLSDSTDLGNGFINWAFSVDNSAIVFLGEGETLTQVYDVTLDDGHDGGAVTRAVTITLTGINQAPSAEDDFAAIREDELAAVTGNVLGNDRDPDHATALKVVGAGSFQGDYGVLTLLEDGSYSYTLDQAAVQFLGRNDAVTETFDYSISDGSAGTNGSASAVLTISIAGDNDAPVVLADAASVTEDGVLTTSGNVLSNDIDVDAGATLFVNAPGTFAGQFGELTLAADGSYSYRLDSSAVAVQALRAGEVVTDTFSYEAGDGTAVSQATLVVSIAGANDAPAAVADQAGLREDGAPVSTGNVLSNDSDVDGGTALGVVSPGSFAGTYGSLVLGADGSYSYTLANGSGAVQALREGQTVTDVFGYVASDGAATSASALTIAITGANDAPVLVHPLADGSVSAGSAFSLTIDANSFSDIDAGDVLDYSAALSDGGALPSWLAFDAATRTFSGTPAAADAGTLQLRVAATDSAGAGAADVFTLTINSQAGRTIIGTACDDFLIGTELGDLIDGRGGNDVMLGRRGDDRYYVDNSCDVVFEQAGQGNDTVFSSVTYTLTDNVENLMLTGNASIGATGNSASNLLVGNAVGNILSGKSGNDILQGLGGNDTLSASGGRTLFDGGAGADALTGGSGNEMFIGGLGNDTITTGTGKDLIAFNAGDGRDLINASSGADNILSLGGGIRYADLKLARSGADLVLKTGGADQITFKDWYAGWGKRSVAKLQIFTEEMPGFDQGSSNPLLNDKVEQFNFTALASAFDAAGQVNGWALTNALLNAHLSGSDSAALGGDLAYQYANNGSLSGIGLGAAQEVLNAPQFGSSAQTLRPTQDLQQGQTRLA